MNNDQPPIPEGADIEYAAFGWRVLAFWMDGIVWAFPYLIYRVSPEFVQNWAVLGFVIITHVLYKPLMEWRYGATLGKMVLKMKIVTPENQLMNLQQTLLRNWAYIGAGLIDAYTVSQNLTDSQVPMPLAVVTAVIGLFLFASGISVAVHSQARGLNDMLAGVICVRVLGKSPKS